MVCRLKDGAAIDVAGVEGDLQKVLGKNVRAHRVARNLSQEAFADFLGVHRTYLGAIERGEKNLSLRSIERLAARLGSPPLDLLEDPAKQPPGEPEGAPGHR